MPACFGSGVASWVSMSRGVAIVIAAMVVSLQGCAPLPRRDPVPEIMTEQAVIPDIPHARLWLDRDIKGYTDMIVRRMARERMAAVRDGLRPGALPPIQFLSISGGGDNGAFAAGVLTGWTASGTRPEFTAVTGISAGALIAPFAYLGPKYDDVLRRVVTSLHPGDVFHERDPLSGLLSDGFASSEPLRRLVEKYVTPELLKEIAREDAKGRALEIGTTDLDAGRQVVWDMGAIAASGAAGALELFRNVMIASTSIPGAVSPVMIDVQVDGRPYQEMHVDGGVITQLFTYPARALPDLEKAIGTRFSRDIHVYLIRNGRLEPEWTPTPRRTLSIGERAIGALVQAEGIGDVHRVYRTALQDGVDFNLAYIGSDFRAASHPMFESAYMRALYDYGYHLAAGGSVWHKSPPDEPVQSEYTLRGRRDGSRVDITDGLR